MSHVHCGMFYITAMSNEPNLFNYTSVPGGLWFKGIDAPWYLTFINPNVSGIMWMFRCKKPLNLCSNIDSNIFTLFSQVRKLRLRHISILLVRVLQRNRTRREERKRRFIICYKEIISCDDGVWQVPRSTAGRLETQEINSSVPVWVWITAAQNP